MGILIDQNKNLVTILVMYIEEQKKQGNSIFHFIHNEQELNDWKSRGYNLKEDIERSSTVKESNDPGLPIKPKLDPEKKINTIKTWWKRMTWKEQNNIYSKCMFQKTAPDGKTYAQIDGIKFRDMKLKTCLKKWDIVDDKGQEIPVTEEVVDSLIPEVAQDLLQQFEQVTEEQ